MLYDDLVQYRSSIVFTIDNMIVSRERGIRWASAALPTFHTLGIYMQFYSPLINGEAIGLYTPQAPAAPVIPNPQNVIDVVRATRCTGVPSIPAFIEVRIMSWFA